MSEPRTDAPPFSFAEAEEALGRSWKWLLAAGLVALVAGILAILLPGVSSIAVATLIGILLLFAAGALVVDALAVRHQVGRMLLRLLFAVLYLAAGIIILASPLTGTVTLTLVLGVLFVVEGSMRAAMAVANRDVPARGWQAGAGVLTILLGVLIVATWPSSANWAIGLLFGVNLAVWGWNMLALALVGRRAASARLAAPAPA